MESGVSLAGYPKWLSQGYKLFLLLWWEFSYGCWWDIYIEFQPCEILTTHHYQWVIQREYCIPRHKKSGSCKYLKARTHKLAQDHFCYVPLIKAVPEPNQNQWQECQTICDCLFSATMVIGAPLTSPVLKNVLCYNWNTLFLYKFLYIML